MGQGAVMDIHPHDVTSEQLDTRNTSSHAPKSVDIFDRRAPFSRCDLGSSGRWLTRIVFAVLWFGLMASLMVFLWAIIG